MLAYGSKVEQEPPKRASGGIHLKKHLEEWLPLLRRVLRIRGERGPMKAVDLNRLVEPYFDSGLYLAVTRDNTRVVATGTTIQDAEDQAAAQGCSEPVIMRAPSRAAMENSLHL
jgi:hypothetical protein